MWMQLTENTSDKPIQINLRQATHIEQQMNFSSIHFVGGKRLDVNEDAKDITFFANQNKDFGEL